MARDHFLPQGYLRGFVHPRRLEEQRPLFVLDVASQRWHERSPTEIAYGHGFYGSSEAPGLTEAIERAFRGPERVFPLLRERIRRQGPSEWVRYRRSLGAYAAFLATRSPFFLEQTLAASPQGSGDARVRALEKMLHELLRRPRQWAFRLHWSLRYIQDPDFGFPTGDRPVICDGTRDTLDESLADPASVLVCPLSWDFALLGSIAPFRAAVEHVSNNDLERIRFLIRRHATRFVVAPLPLL